MRVTRFVFLSCLAIATFITTGLPNAQTPAPARSPAQAAGTARITGRIVAADTGGGLRSTAVRLIGGGLRTPKIVGTDTDGRYELTELPPGRYTLSAIKPGYVTLNYGQRRPFENGQNIDVADKQTIENVNIALPRGGVIVAHITDESGEPMTGVGIQIERYRFVQGERRLTTDFALSTSGYTATDDRGDLREYGLPPGDYYVRAILRGSARETMPAQNGQMYVATYYPRTASPASARSVAVEAGREVHVSISMVATRLARVSGSVTTSNGSPTRALMYLVGPGTENRSVSVGPDGKFSIADIWPGDYWLTATSQAGRPDSEYGRVPITIAGSDLDNVSVVTGTLGAMRGRLVYDSPTPPTTRPTSIQLMTPFTQSTYGASGRTSLNNDSTFEMTGLAGDRLFRLATQPTQPDTWLLKAVIFDGRDITDIPLNFDGGRNVAGVEVIVTRRFTELTGRVVDNTNRAVTDYTVVVFSDEREKWIGQSRFIAAARPDQQSAFKITGLPPGRYLATALDYLEAGSERDPDVLDRLRRNAVPITLAEGEAKTISLNISPN